MQLLFQVIFSFGHAKILVKLEFYPIQNGGVGAKRPLPTIFSPVTSTNVQLAPKTF